MDKLNQYRQIIIDLLTKYAEILNRNPRSDQEASVVTDTIHDHYLLTLLGWRQDRRVRSNVVYLRLRNQKIWIEEDGLEQGIAVDLIEAGVPKEDIVLAFHHPNVRPLTEFAVA